MTNVCIVSLDSRVTRYVTNEKGYNYDPSWWAPTDKALSNNNLP